MPRPQLLPENVYGHTRKVAFFISALETEKARRGGGLRILDLGCGTGYAVSQFLPEDDDQLVGLDMHGESVRWASENYRDGRFHFEMRAAEEIDSDLAPFDVVVLSDILEHVEAPDSILAIANRHLISNGILLVSVPNGYGPFEMESAFARTKVGTAMLGALDRLCALANKTIMRGRWTRAAAREPIGIPYNAESGHVQFFSKHEIVGKLEAAGFCIEAITGLSVFCGPYSNYIIGPFPSLVDANVRLAERATSGVCSAWAFVCRKATNDETMASRR